MSFLIGYRFSANRWDFCAKNGESDKSVCLLSIRVLLYFLSRVWDLHVVVVKYSKQHLSEYSFPSTAPLTPLLTAFMVTSTAATVVSHISANNNRLGLENVNLNGLFHINPLTSLHRIFNPATLSPFCDPV